MKRRNFALLAGTSFAALKFGYAHSQTAMDKSLLTSTLTPLGAERAGNADGSIPAWTGGNTTIPDGWKDGDYVPDLFATDQLVVVIDASNMAEHADRLSEGTMALMKKYGYKIKVYPTRRSASAPQWVYDNTAENVARAKLEPAGPRLGFLGAFGGIPFPIPDTSDPLSAGAQIIWNHTVRWSGEALLFNQFSYVVNDGQLVLSSETQTYFDYPYYRQNGSPESWNGLSYRAKGLYAGPATLIGEIDIAWVYADPYAHSANPVWITLEGQGRVRRAPQENFDTPAAPADGACNYDEYYGFNGSLEQYDWKYISKKEMYIPYNNNALAAATASAAHLQHFLDPELVRWELHRVWVVEATLHSGYRNVLARRVLYSDEDTWQISLIDAYDSNDNLFHTSSNYNQVRPDLPGTVYMTGLVNNLQTDNYISTIGLWDQKAHPSLTYVAGGYPDSLFDPQNMAANAQY